MELQGRGVALFGTLHSIGNDEAIRRLRALGATVTEVFTEATDLIVCAFGERGPIPRTDAMLRTPYLDEDALLGLLERGERGDPGAYAAFQPQEEPPPFVPPGALATAMNAEALRAVLADADWSAFVPGRDLPPLRAVLAELEGRAGVAEAHRLATRRLRDAGAARLLHPFGHDAEITGHALSPDGRYLATGSGVGDDYYAGGVLQVWEVATGRCVNTLRGIDGGVGWDDYRGTIQWSADSARLAMTFSTNRVGVWDPTGESSEPIAAIDVSDGNSRPSEYALSPDGRRVYHHCGTNGDGGLQGCLVPLDRGGLHWLPNHVETDHPYTMARRLPDAVRRQFEEQDRAEKENQEGPRRVYEDGFRVGQWIERPVWYPDGTRLFGANAICVDAVTRRVLWHAPARIARLSPDGSLVAAVTDRGLFFRDASDGRIRCGPFALGRPCALRWAPGRATPRLAVLTPNAGGATVHVFDEERHVGGVEIAHPEWGDDERWIGDREAWAWAPGGERAACLTATGVVEIWSFEDPAHARRLRTVSATRARAVYWGAGDTLVLVDDRRVRFVRADTGEEVGDFPFQRVPAGPRPVEGDALDDFEDQIFALDDHLWAMTLAPDAVVAPLGHEETLDAVLAWSVGRHHAWPVRWGGVRVLPDVLTALGVLDSEDADTLREYEEELRELAARPAEPAAWPPPNTASLDELFEVARKSLTNLDHQSWGYHTGRHLRYAARLRARHGEVAGAKELLHDILELPTVIAANSDVAVILARGGLTSAARDVFEPADALVDDSGEFGEELDADTASSFAAACQALGDTARAEEWFRRARAAITVEPNPWEDHLAVCHAMLECGREDLVREVLADRIGHPPVGYHSEAEWLVHLIGGGRLDLARAFQELPGWEVPSEVLTALAEAGRPDLLETWGDHNWAVSDELVDRARRAAETGTPPLRPLRPTDADVRALARRYAEIQRVPHARRQMPIRELIGHAATCGHLSAVLELLKLVPETDDFNDRPGQAFRALWIALTGFDHAPW